jgi:hypothetical protein
MNNTVKMLPRENPDVGDMMYFVIVITWACIGCNLQVWHKCKSEFYTLNNEKNSYEHRSIKAFFPSYSPLFLSKIFNAVSNFVAFPLHSVQCWTAETGKKKRGYHATNVIPLSQMNFWQYASV